MRKVLAVIVGAIGVVLAVYVGLWLMFVGGIEQVIDTAQEDPVDGGEVAWGVVKVIFAGSAAAFVLYASLGLAYLVGGWRENRW